MAHYQPWGPAVPQGGRGPASRRVAGHTTEVTTVLLAAAGLGSLDGVPPGRPGTTTLENFVMQVFQDGIKKPRTPLRIPTVLHEQVGEGFGEAAVGKAMT